MAKKKPCHKKNGQFTRCPGAKPKKKSRRGKR